MTLGVVVGEVTRGGGALQPRGRGGSSSSSSNAKKKKKKKGPADCPLATIQSMPEIVIQGAEEEEMEEKKEVEPAEEDEYRGRRASTPGLASLTSHDGQPLGLDVSVGEDGRVTVVVVKDDDNDILGWHDDVANAGPWHRIHLGESALSVGAGSRPSSVYGGPGSRPSSVYGGPGGAGASSRRSSVCSNSHSLLSAPWAAEGSVASAASSRSVIAESLAAVEEARHAEENKPDLVSYLIMKECDKCQERLRDNAILQGERLKSHFDPSNWTYGTPSTFLSSSLDGPSLLSSSSASGRMPRDNAGGPNLPKYIENILAHQAHAPKPAHHDAKTLKRLSKKFVLPVDPSDPAAFTVTPGVTRPPKPAWCSSKPVLKIVGTFAFLMTFFMLLAIGYMCWFTDMFRPMSM